jgi:hypothetical protein
LCIINGSFNKFFFKNSLASINCVSGQDGTAAQKSYNFVKNRPILKIQISAESLNLAKHNTSKIKLVAGK